MIDDPDLVAIAQEYCGQAISDDNELEDKRYVLFERGRYGAAYVTAHDSLEEASEYTLNQEYAEDWVPQVILDRESATLLRPDTITWKPVP